MSVPEGVCDLITVHAWRVANGEEERVAKAEVFFSAPPRLRVQPRPCRPHAFRSSRRRVSRGGAEARRAVWPERAEEALRLKLPRFAGMEPRQPKTRIPLDLQPDVHPAAPGGMRPLGVPDGLDPTSIIRLKLPAFFYGPRAAHSAILPVQLFCAHS
jgi:hypothetical protein